MAYSLDTIEITQDNQEWAERLGMDPAFEELLYSSGGLKGDVHFNVLYSCLSYTSPSPRDRTSSRMPSSV